MQTLLQAVARMEGFFVAGSRAARNNNPGNIEYGKFALAHGSIGIEHTNGTIKPRFAVFPDATTGFACLRALLSAPMYLGESVRDALNTYAPPVENQTNAYITNVCEWCGVTPETIITRDLIG